MRTPSKIKRLLLTNKLWLRFHEKYKDRIRPVVIENITKILACGTNDMGFAKYRCSNEGCGHTKTIAFSCKSRFCPTCGKKTTDQWIAKMQQTLPDTPWQHVTFTMPAQLWLIFKMNRTFLLKQLSRITASTLLNVAKKKNILPGIFTALHTFGRDLKWNCHVHLSITMGGLSSDHSQYKKLYFDKYAVEPQWRYQIITLLRDHYEIIQLPKHTKQICPDKSYFNRFLNQQYRKTWIVHFAKPSKDHFHNIRYLGSYIKRPPISMSRLKHYDGTDVRFQYFDHKTKNNKFEKLDSFTFIKKFIQHIPEKHFRMINYYGFLANRVRGQLLPKVRDLLGQTVGDIPKITHADLLQKSFGIDPLKCILCNSQMALESITLGVSITILKLHHLKLATGKPISALP